MNKQTHPLPWYKEKWLWLIISLPLSVIIGCIFTVNIAFKNADTVVNNDLQSRGLTAEGQLEQEVMAKKLGISASLSIERRQGQVVLILTHKQPIEMPSELTLHLTHATLAEYDQQITLKKTNENEYTGELQNFYAGKRYLSLLPNKGNWELKGTVELFSSSAQHIG